MTEWNWMEISLIKWNDAKKKVSEKRFNQSVLGRSFQVNRARCSREKSEKKEEIKIVIVIINEWWMYHTIRKIIHKNGDILFRYIYNFFFRFPCTALNTITLRYRNTIFVLFSMCFVRHLHHHHPLEFFYLLMMVSNLDWNNLINYAIVFILTRYDGYADRG